VPLQFQPVPVPKGVVLLEDSSQLRAVTFPPSFRPLLKGLWVTGCPQLAQLDLSGLKALQQLRITGCPQLQEVQGLSNLRKLEVLELGGCSAQLVRPLAGWKLVPGLCAHHLHIRTVPQCHGATVPRCHGTTVPRYRSTNIIGKGDVVVIVVQSETAQTMALLGVSYLYPAAATHVLSPQACSMHAVRKYTTRAACEMAMVLLGVC
jgi:hypothetical protein